MQYILCLLLVVPLALGEIRRPRCPGGYEEGSEATLGRYYYKCHDGTLEPLGCIDARGQRVPLGSTTDAASNDYRFECTLDRSGFLQFEYKACLYNGRAYGVNDRWNDDKYIYVCTKQGDYMRMDVAGCMDQGREVSVNEKVIKGDFVYQCKQTVNGTCSMCPVGCAKNGREYQLDQAFDEGQFWFACQKTDGRIYIKAQGCINQGKRLKDSDHFTTNENAYECQVTDNTVKAVLVGCAATDDRGQAVEKQFGVSWADQQFEYQCKQDETGTRAKKVPVKCVHRTSNGGSLYVQPGCYQVNEGSAVGCVKDGADRLRSKTYRLDEIGTQSADGVRYC